MRNEFGFRSVFQKKALRDMEPNFKGSLREITSQVLSRADEFCELKKHQSIFREKHGLPQLKDEEHGKPTKVDELYSSLAQDRLSKGNIDDLIIRIKEPESVPGITLSQATSLLNELVHIKLQDFGQSPRNEEVTTSPRSSGQGAETTKSD